MQRVGVRDHSQIGLPGDLADPFVIHEKEHLVFFDRSAESASELIFPEGLLHRGGEGGRVQRAVANEFVCRTVVVVGPRPRHRVDHRAVAPVLRAVSIREHLKLGDGIDAQRRSQNPRARSAVLIILDVCAVEDFALPIGTRAGNRPIVAETDVGIMQRAGARFVDHARSQQDQFLEVAPVERQIAHLR